jgi:DNA-binding transcriptional ArsR family regulator
MKYLWLFEKNKLKILHALYLCQSNLECCVLLDNLGISKHLLSYHLKTLLQKNIIQGKKEGRNKNYQIRKPELLKIKEILKIVDLI